MEESAQELNLKMEQIEIDSESLKDYFNTKSVSWKIRKKHFEIKDITINNFEFDLFDSYLYPLCFKNCIFDCEIREVEGLSLSIKQPISFLNCTFKKDVIIFDFHFHIIAMLNCVFESKCYFEFSIFNKFANFRGTTFNYVSFEGSKFNDDANFYGVKFDKAPNFSQVQFKGSLNAVNTEMLFQVQDLKNTIKEAKEKYDIESNVNKSLIYFINDFRDSFRILKNASIKDNNLLDASNSHKCELYCKEVELDSKKTKTLRDKVDKWQLWFYRKLCDHHTDILKSFHSLMLVIGLFGLMSLGVIVGFDYCLGYKPILSHLYMIKEIYDAHIQSFIKTHTLYTFAFNIFILAFYLVILVCLISVKYLREVFIGVSYFIVISILLISPKILIPAMGIFTDKRVLLDPLSTLGGIYTIVFGFVLFSFIKTIRKNSIVPS
ncbi:pentapeptide repeat-containing protein [Helicobacter pullorum]|uniref:pentapeptide repeat-containing protein n=1 Tax=Helicobacter pullorum TaxID=35818 RepID=UPI0007619449|nr:pentapeptide repeat-containing protein [Helicobacter pullorum]